jgi:flagellar biosynthetic protein FliQ
MSPQQASDIVSGMLWMAFWVSAPLLAVGFAAGVLISIVQIVTSIQDSAFATVPRLLAFLVALMLSLPWMLTRLLNYTSRLLSDFTPYVH